MLAFSALSLSRARQHTIKRDTQRYTGNETLDPQQCGDGERAVVLYYGLAWQVGSGTHGEGTHVPLPHASFAQSFHSLHYLLQINKPVQ